MYRKIVITAAAAAAVVGSGTAALAATGSGGAGSSGSNPAAGRQLRPPRPPAIARYAAHGQVVIKGRDGKYATHDFARGRVERVSTNAIVVRTPDGTNQRFAVTSDTKVRLCTSPGHGTPGKITDVKVGDYVLVTGTGTDTYTAKHVMDAGTNPPKEPERGPVPPQQP
jgi:hypothetical protein